MGLALCAACTWSGPGSTDVEALIGEGQQAFLQADFLRAGEIFAAAEAAGPKEEGAVYGRARTLQTLHQYDEALAAYERALTLAPDDGLAWEGYVSALTWGGILQGDRRLLVRALEAGKEAILAAPERVEIYANLGTAAGELNELPQYLQLLEAAAAERPEEPVVKIELYQERLQRAASRQQTMAANSTPETAAKSGREPADEKNAQQSDSDREHSHPVSEQGVDIENQLRADLEKVATDTLTAHDQPPGNLFLLAVGHQLLGEPERAAVALELLEDSEEGRRLAQPLRYEQFLDDWVASYMEEPERKLEVLERWKERFKPSWEAGSDHYRAISGMEFGVLAAKLRGDRLLAGMNADAPTPSLEDVDRLVALGEQLAHLDTWGGATYYLQTSDLLVTLDQRLEEALDLAREGLAALEEDRPGLIYPGEQPAAREESKRSYIAGLTRVEGLALGKLDGWDEAEKALRRAVELRPDGPDYAALGEALLRRGRAAEAYDALVTALAQGFGSPSSVLEEQTRAAAAKAAELAGKPKVLLDHDVVARSQEVESDRQQQLITHRLNTPAPDFELEDTSGRTWRLFDLAGKVVILNYWATWCGPCIAEFPYYKELVEEYAGSDGVVFLAISTDADSSVVKPWLDGKGYEFTVLYDRGSATDYHVSAIPASFLIGRDGRIQYRTNGFAGADRYVKEMRLRIESLRVELTPLSTGARARRLP